MTAPSTDARLRTAIAVLTLGTAIIHLTLAFPDPAFILNGLGYLTLLAALLLPQTARYHGIAGWVLVGYTALSIGLWVLFGARSTIGFLDKVIEVVLILVLVLWLRRRRNA